PADRYHTSHDLVSYRLYAVTYSLSCSLFFFNDTATPQIYTLSLHDALPISPAAPPESGPRFDPGYVTAMSHFYRGELGRIMAWRDRKSTRLNSSHVKISYAVFCLKKKITY